MGFATESLFPTQLIPKKEPGMSRLLLDLRYLNTFLKTFRFRYEGVQNARFAFKENDWLFSLDLTNGYHHVGINRDSWDYLFF